MPFTYRDKPKLADRFRGKSGAEILNELKSDLDPQERRMFFDSPSWRTRQNNSGFSRGFPFDDDRNRINIRTYLDEIAARHPEFADQLREPHWREDLVDPSFHKPEFSQNEQSCGNKPQASGSQIPEEAKEPQAVLTSFGLRNTVPLGPGANVDNTRHQRSMSAPPENRTGEKEKRFVTKCEIPVMNNPVQDPAQMKPELPGKGVQEPPQQKPNNAPNVRVIPIQVEGRDTPIVNTNIDMATNFGAETFHDSGFEGRLPRDFGSYQRHSPRFAHKERTPSPTPYQYAPQYQQYAPQGPQFGPNATQFMPQQRFAPPHPQHFASQHPQKPPPPPHRQEPQQHQHRQEPQQHQHRQEPQQHQQEPRPQAEEVNSKPPPKPEPPKDPMEKVEAIQKEVDKLMEQVKAFKGNSRTDKQYMILDELLTRQLLLLDIIETEGKENVRQARKDTIHSIQRCISLLENKVPVSENTGMESTENEGEKKAEESGGMQKMEVDTVENATGEKKVENMDVDEKGSEKVQEQQQQQQVTEESKEKV